jgi:SulP family sulfate permease
MVSPALAIAILGIVEAMSIAKSLASQRGERIDANQEIVGQGLANVGASFASGMPGTGSFTRSAVNFHAGANTRFAGVFSGLIVLLAIVALAPYARYIPQASLAAMLMVISFGMIDFHSLKVSWKATSSDRIVIALTFLSTLILELEKAVYVGVILSIFLFLRKASHPSVYKMVPSSRGQRLRAYESGLADCSQINIYQIDGAFFFGAVSELEDKLQTLSETSGNVIILRLKGVRLMDATGAHALENFIKLCRKKGLHLIITNVKPSVEVVMRRTGLDTLLGRDHITADTTEAVRLAMARYLDKEKCKACARELFIECDRGQ